MCEYTIDIFNYHLLHLELECTGMHKECTICLFCLFWTSSAIQRSFGRREWGVCRKLPVRWRYYVALWPGRWLILDYFTTRTPCRKHDVNNKPTSSLHQLSFSALVCFCSFCSRYNKISPLLPVYICCCWLVPSSVSGSDYTEVMDIVIWCKYL